MLFRSEKMRKSEKVQEEARPFPGQIQRSEFGANKLSFSRYVVSRRAPGAYGPGRRRTWGKKFGTQKKGLDASYGPFSRVQMVATTRMLHAQHAILPLTLGCRVTWRAHAAHMGPGGGIHLRWYSGAKGGRGRGMQSPHGAARKGHGKEIGRAHV